MRIMPHARLIPELGMATSATISYIAALTERPVFGFDSFQGLPEDCRGGFMKGVFAGGLPDVPRNVQLIEVWFSDTSARDARFFS
jgi:hypothetical protein